MEKKTQKTSVRRNDFTKFLITIYLFQLKKQADSHINQFDSDEGSNQTAHSVNQDVAKQQSAGSNGLVRHAPQGQRNQDGDNDCIENNRRQDGTFRTMQMHDIQRSKFWNRNHEQRNPGRQGGRQYG